jgi:nucleoid-associated protein YgaU
MNQTQKGVLIAIAIVLLGGVSYVALKPQKESAPGAAQETAAPSAEPAKPASSMTDLGATVDKTSRLMAEATTATTEMKTLYQDGKTPEAPALNTARGKVETALNGVVAIEIPESAEGAPADMVRKARDNAAKALGILKTLPADSAGALAALGQIEATLSGKAPEVAAEPAKPAPAAAPATETAAPAAPTQAAQTPPAPEASNEIANTPPPVPSPAAGASAGTEIASIAPAFDLVRVEPDGSTVIAGRAAEGDRVEILDGEKVLSATKATSGGDFVAVFEDPLPPGDHQLTIRAIGEDGKTAVSRQVATVSVPKDRGEGLLAMVSEPGAASRVITAPGAPAQPAAQPASATTETAAATPSAPAAAPQPSTMPAAAVKAALQISAVELEGDRIFVAGTADPNSTVTAYADDRLIGQDTADADGRFIVDGEVPLAVGQHRIRVDQTGADGKVAFRVEVPFDRPEGEQFAAVAAPSTAASDATTGGAAMQPLGDGAFDAARNEAVKAFGLLQSLFADGKTPTAEQYAAARSSTQIALQTLIDFVLPAGANEASKELVEKTRASAAKALALVKALPAGPADARSALAAIEALIRETVAPSSGGAAPAPAVASATPDPSAPATASDAAAPAAAGEPAQVAQAPLTEAKNSVIIRRGDTLWQISRRVYGLGVRYTTIYLANREQITNPDRILPGQVFGVPNEALPNAEQLHRQRLHGEKIQ